jgi:MtN3 and saliva related transmembrane protein
MSVFATVIGLVAAACTTAANLPQLKKAWTTGETDDISLKTLLLFACGLGLWVVYGVLREDIVIILANGISAACWALVLEVAADSLLSAPAGSGTETSLPRRPRAVR